jgi:hypothetical protein
MRATEVEFVNSTNIKNSSTNRNKKGLVMAYKNNKSNSNNSGRNGRSSSILLTSMPLLDHTRATS